nr:hypothetical protein [Embleya scabrispora]
MGAVVAGRQQREQGAAGVLVGGGVGGGGEFLQERGQVRGQADVVAVAAVGLRGADIRREVGEGAGRGVVGGQVPGAQGVAERVDAHGDGGFVAVGLAVDALDGHAQGSGDGRDQRVARGAVANLDLGQHALADRRPVGQLPLGEAGGLA